MAKKRIIRAVRMDGTVDGTVEGNSGGEWWRETVEGNSGGKS